jgi:hypothetical protein
MTDERGIIVPAHAFVIPGNAFPHLIENIRIPYPLKIIAPHRSNADVLFQTRVYIPPRIQAHHEHTRITPMRREGPLFAKVLQEFVHVPPFFLERRLFQLLGKKLGIKMK